MAQSAEAVHLDSQEDEPVVVVALKSEKLEGTEVQVLSVAVGAGQIASRHSGGEVSWNHRPPDHELPEAAAPDEPPIYPEQVLEESVSWHQGYTELDQAA